MLRRFIPQAILDYLHYLKNMERFPGCSIHAQFVGVHAKIGQECSLDRHVVVESGVSIGDYSYVNHGTLISSGSIGKYCSIGPYCIIGLDEHPIGFPSTSPRTFEPSQWDSFSHPPYIGNDVWIGAHCIILQGVCIGDGSVIGAGSVVTRDVEPYGVVVGSPAKVIKKRFSDNKIDELLASRWWDREHDEVIKLLAKMKDR